MNAQQSQTKPRALKMLIVNLHQLMASEKKIKDVQVQIYKLDQ